MPKRSLLLKKKGISLHMSKKSITFAAAKVFMKAQKGHILYRIDRIAGMVMKVDAAILFVLLILACFDLSNWYVWAVFGGIILVCCLIRMVLEFFVKTEDEEAFEAQVEYIVEQRLSQQKQAHKEAIKDYSPLCKLSDAEAESVEQLLYRLPANPNHAGHINLALIAQYLTALQRMGYADLADKYHLRLWVAEVTKKEVPSSSQFNEAIPSTATTKINKAQKELEQLLH